VHACKILLSPPSIPSNQLTSHENLEDEDAEELAAQAERRRVQDDQADSIQHPYRPHDIQAHPQSNEPPQEYQSFEQYLLQYQQQSQQQLFHSKIGSRNSSTRHSRFRISICKMINNNTHTSPSSLNILKN
jgi:hypothetical protein